MGVPRLNSLTIALRWVIVTFLLAISLWILIFTTKLPRVTQSNLSVAISTGTDYSTASGTFQSATGGTFQFDTGGTFESDMPGTFESDTSGTFCKKQIKLQHFSEKLIRQFSVIKVRQFCRTFC